MSPDIETMREYVRKMYSGERWRRRVHNMSDGQVTAIYLKQLAKVTQEELKKKNKDQDIPF